jgi:hypothetical protein
LAPIRVNRFYRLPGLINPPRRSGLPGARDPDQSLDLIDIGLLGFARFPQTLTRFESQKGTPLR